MGSGRAETPGLTIGRWLSITLLTSLMVFLCLGYLGWQQYQQFLKAPLNQWHYLNAEVTFEIQPGQGMRAITRSLKRQGLLSQPEYWDILVISSRKLSRLQAGEYEITAELTPPQLLQQITTGKVKQHRLTVPEGLTFKQLRQMVQQHPQLASVLRDKTDAEIMSRLHHAEQAPEGLFLPDTFYFPKGLTDLEFLRRAYQSMAEYLAEQWLYRAPGLPYKNAYEALIMASIIEKEAAHPEEMAAIAGVFVRRLQQNMRLQTDPTVIYGMGEAYQGNIRREDLLQDTPYNTYVHEGLPPTPIALPGRAAIHAALQPAAGEYLYFVAKGNTGWHHFSVTLAEHNQAVQQYQLLPLSKQE